jgi:hypothetical protein
LLTPVIPYKIISRVSVVGTIIFTIFYMSVASAWFIASGQKEVKRDFTSFFFACSLLKFAVTYVIFFPKTISRYYFIMIAVTWLSVAPESFHDRQFGIICAR